MFDCHAHLTDSSLIDELDEHLVGAEAAGVTGIVSVSESLEDANQVPLNMYVDCCVCSPIFNILPVA